MPPSKPAPTPKADMATPRARPTRSAAAAAASSTSLAGSRTSALSATSSSSGSRSPASTSNASGSLTRKAGTAARSLMAPTASSAARATPARGGSGGATATTASRARKVQPNATPTAATVGKNKAVVHASQSSFSGESVDYEPIKVYLRVRPPTATSSDAAETNLSILSPTEVLMTPPTGLARHNQASPMKYTFTRVYAPSALLNTDSKPPASPSDSGTSQADFFRGTTLPLVEQLLQGSNGLVYTYGVTNSGKSYTILGQPGVGGAGILPRTLDVVFNSIQGLQSDSNIRPVGFSGVELGSPESSASPAGTGINPYSRPTRGGGQWEREETTLAVDRNYRYSIWVSYVEVYNEKVYDLLDVPPAPAASLNAQLTGGRSGMTRSGSRMGSSFSIAGIAASGGPLFQRNSLKIATASESEGRGKYVANATEVKVQTAEEARALIQRGDENRQVFGTAANRVSSRSHGIFTIRLVREHGGAMGDVTYCSTARLSIVDLAGTERTANTGTTGDRFKEASSINQSLMVLGLCIDTLRQNQARAASRLIPTQKPISSIASSSASADAAPTLLPLRKGRPLTVPFAQSMLTQLFANFFTGDGQAVMCANINPWDTGFDENAAVLKFSGRAQEVSTARAAPKTLTVSESLRKIWPPPGTTTSGKMDETAAATPRRGIPVSTTRNAAPSKGAADARTGREAAEMLAAAQVAAHEITIIEVEEEDEDDEEDARDPVIPMLLQQFEEMRQRLYESELRCARIEAEVRVEMADEMAERLYEVERRYTERLQADTKHNEDFVNRKIDLLVRANNAGAEQRRTASGASAGTETPRRKQERKDAEEVEATLAVLAEEDSMLEDEEDEEESQCEESEASVQLQAGPLDSSGILAKRLARMSVDGDVSAFSTSSDSASAEAEEQDTPQISTRRSAEAVQEDESMREASDEEDTGTEREEAGEISIDVDDEEEEEGSQLSEESDEEEEEEEEHEASSDASFDVTKEVDSSFEAPVAPRRSAASAAARKSAAKPAQGRSSTKRAAATRSSVAVPLAEHSQSASASLGTSTSYASLQSSNSDEASDASLIHVRAKAPRKKRTLRKKAVDETTMLEQIGDSSLVEALQRSSSHSGSIARRGIR